jgi:hypothetical protein
MEVAMNSEPIILHPLTCGVGTATAAAIAEAARRQASR